MLRAPAAPAPTAIQISAVNPIIGCRCPGATMSSTSAVNTTSDITRGFISAMKSPTLASLDARRRSEDNGLGAMIGGGDIGHGSAAHLIRGNSLNWWNGGGDGSVHSSVVAPAPHGLSAAWRFWMKASATP